ncbi:unnamed protein product [Symbiodinium sp. CCMP2592]|nr:unnamed protein product [Symbiodinium sp. CCMP2592]
MFRHPLTQPIMELIEQIMKVSSVSCWLHETDGHLANEKLHYHLYAKRVLPAAAPAAAPAAPVSDKLPTFTEQVLCQNHQVQLTVVSAVDALERVDGLSKMIPGLYCATLFLRMGGHFVRLLASVPTLVRDVGYFRWVAVPSEEDNSGRRYAQELGEYLVDNLRHNSRQMSSTARGGQEAEAKATRAIVRVLMRSLPCVPLLSDWVKLGPNLDFWMASEFQGVLSALLERAPWATQLPQYDGSEDVVFISWQKLAGSRFHRTKQMLSNHQERFRRTLLTLIVEPLRHLHSTLLKYAHSAPNDEEWPPLLQQIWPACSKFYQVLQYYSVLLEGTGTRLRLLWQLSGCESLQQWMTEHPHEAREVRSQILLAAMNLERRFLATLDKYPFKLFALADPRRTDHDEIVEAFYARPACCWKAGLARELRSSLDKGAFLQGLPTLRWLFLMAAFSVKITVAPVERRHATHKQYANRGMPFPLFSAGSILVECRFQASAVARMCEERAQLQRIRDAQAVDAAAPVRLPPSERRQRPAAAGGGRLMRGQTAMELFKWDFLRRERLQGGVVNPCSSDTWQRVKEAWARLSPEQRASLERQSEASKLQAAVNRNIVANERKTEAKNQLALAADPSPSESSERRRVDSLAIMIRDQRQGGVPQAAGVREQMAQAGAPAAEFPIDPEVVTRLAKSRSFNIDAFSKSFSEKAAAIAVGETLPDKVEYPASCGCLCRTTNTQRSIDMHEDLLNILQKIIKGTGLKHVFISQAAVLFAAEQHVEESEYVEASKRAYGPGLCLRHSRKDPCQPLKPPRSPLNQGTSGRPNDLLASLSEDAWAASMVFLQEQPVERVRIVLLEWKFPAQSARLDTYEITQSGQDFCATANPDPPAPRPGAARPGPSDDDQDMLQDLTSRDRQRQRRQPAAVVVDQAQMHNPLDDLIRLAEGEIDAIACPREDEVEDNAESESEEEHAPAARPERRVRRASNRRPQAAQQPAPAPAQAAVPLPAIDPDSLLCEPSSWNFVARANNTPVGRIHFLGETSLKATCRLHKNCVTAISMPSNGSERQAAVRRSRGSLSDPTFQDLESDLKNWLAQGLSCGPQQHQAASLQLRAERWHVKVRQRQARLGGPRCG